MTDLKKLVLMVQPAKMQGYIWQSVLKSQGLVVIWESPDANVTESMEQLHQAGLVLPDLLLIDVRLKAGNAYDLCRWCRDRQPHVKVILTDSSQAGITDYERRWAIYQGAIDFFPAFQRDSLVSAVAAATKRVLEALDGYPLDNGALISVLLSMKRQIEAKALSLAPTRHPTSQPQPQPLPTLKLPEKPLPLDEPMVNGQKLDASKTPTQRKLSYRFGQYSPQS